jgi:hypothetical protein
MLSAIGYDEEAQVLYAEFANTGNIYAYAGVSKEEFEALRKADSIGRYMRHYIIDAYPSVQVRRGREIKW